MQARLAAVAALILLAGCASPQQTVATTAADEGTHVVAVRVVPVNHTVDWNDMLGARPCGLPNGDPCDTTRLTTPGTALDAPLVGLNKPQLERRATDTGALFWRLDGTLRFSMSAQNPDVHLAVYVTKPKGGPDRLLMEAHGASTITIPTTDIYLKDNERDLRFVLDIGQDYVATLVQPVRVSGSLLARAYIDAGDAPVVIQ